MKHILHNLTLLTLIVSAPLTRASTHTWSGGNSSLWSDPGNWEEGTAPKAGESPLGIVIPASPKRLSSYNNIAGLQVTSITIKANNASIDGNQTITLQSPALISLLVSGQSNLISTPLELTSQHVFTIGANGSLEISGPISGNGGIRKMARGSLTLSGAEPNTYTGVTEFRGDGGTLHLKKGGDLFDAIAIPGDLILGDSDQNDFPVSVICYRDNQVADAAKVFIGPNCTYALNGTSDAWSSLSLVKGALVTASLSGPVLPGQLTLFDTITVSNSTANLPASIGGVLALNASHRNVDVQDYSVLEISASIRDGLNAGELVKLGTGTLRLSGANTFAGNVKVTAGVLEALSSKALGATSAASGTYIQNGTTLRLGVVNIVDEHLYLNGSGFVLPGSTSGALEAKKGNAVWSGPITLQTDSTVDVAENVLLTLSGVMDGLGSLILQDLGTVRLAGSKANSYTGATIARGGLLQLNKTPWQSAVPGPFFIGQSNPSAQTNYISRTNVVQLLSDQQMSLDQPVTMEVTGMFDLNGFTQTIGALSMTGAIITNHAAGLLILDGDVTGTSVWNNFPEIHGEVSLGGKNRTFTSLTPGAIELLGNVRDGGTPAGIIKKGPYGLRLDGTNSTYAGITDVQEGWLSAVQPGSLGSPAGGTKVASKAWFTIGLHFAGPVETLTLEDASIFYSVGNNSWDGDIHVLGNARIIIDNAANNETLDLNGIISGPGGITMEKGGTLRLGGTQANTYTGPTVVLGEDQWLAIRQSTLELRKPNGVVAVPGPLIVGTTTNSPSHEIVRWFGHHQIADLAPVVLHESALLDLNNKDESIGSLAGSGLVDLKLGSLTSGANNASTTFSGTVAGTSFAAVFYKEGTGALTLTGNNTLSGSMMVNNGQLFVNGQQTSSVFVQSNGSLRGHGSVGYIHGIGGGTVPGDNLTPPTHGTLKSWSIDLTSLSSFNIDIAGTQEGVDYDQLQVTGTVKLGGATLYLSKSFPGKTGDQFVILRNDGVDPVQGNFAFLPEGTEFNFNGAKFHISYKGGDGNDVVLTQLTQPSGANLGGVSPLPGGEIQVSGSGIPGAGYAVEAADSLNSPVTWIHLGDIKADAQGQLKFKDPDAPKHSMRFYRFLSL